MRGVDGKAVAELGPLQQEIVSYPREGGGRLFVRGLPGTGKSTALMARLVALLKEGRRPYEILVLVPQRAQVERYERALSRLEGPTRGGAELVTFYGLVRRAVALYWPLVARAAGFEQADQEPVFLTLETAQYFMWRVVEPLIREEGYFGDLAIRRERLLSQLIDNLNKSALVGFDHTDIYARLKGAWTGAQDKLNSYWQAQDCAIRFRNYCLSHNLLDFSLVTEVYHRYLFPHPVYRRHFQARYRHLLVDNLEENVPVAHEMIAWAMERCESTVLAFDEGGGHRLFLGADAEGALDLEKACSKVISLTTPVVASTDVLAFSDALRQALRVESVPVAPEGVPSRAIVDRGGGRYWIGMIHWIVGRIVELLDGGTQAGEIAIIAPYVSEVMRFAIEEELGARGIDLYLLRPSTPLREEPLIRGLLTLVLLGHPDWPLRIQGEAYSLPVEDVALALRTTLAGLDPIRSQYLARAALPLGERVLRDLSGSADSGSGRENLGRLWENVGYQVAERYEALRLWISSYHEGDPEPVDIFLSRVFGDLLSRPGYGFCDETARARAYGRLVESAAKFRSAVGLDGAVDDDTVAREYVQLVLEGTASAEYLLDWPRPPQEDAVILAPAYSYLTRDLRSSYQFWIDLGSDGWTNRPNQPLTHPYVLSKHWPVGKLWRDVEEEQAKREVLGKVIQGLAARCTKGVYLAFSELGIDGVEQRGQLQRAIVKVLSRMVADG